MFVVPIYYSFFYNTQRGIGEAKYMPVSNWGSLNTLLNDALKVIAPLPKATPPPTQGYNELNAAMDLVLFEDAMSHICKVTHKSHPRATSYNPRSTEPWNLPEPIFSWLV